MSAEKIEAIKQEYETVGEEVRATFGRIRDEDLGKRSGNPKWKVGTVAAHLATSPGQVSGFTGRVTAGKGTNIPVFVINIGNAFNGFRNRGMKPADMLRRYNEGHAKMVTAIDAARDADWEREVSLTGGRGTLETWFTRTAIEHERGHVAEITAGLG